MDYLEDFAPWRFSSFWSRMGNFNRNLEINFLWIPWRRMYDKRSKDKTRKDSRSEDKRSNHNQEGTKSRKYFLKEIKVSQQTNDFRPFVLFNFCLSIFCPFDMLSLDLLSISHKIHASLSRFWKRCSCRWIRLGCLRFKLRLFVFLSLNKNQKGVLCFVRRIDFGGNLPIRGKTRHLRFERTVCFRMLFSP